jgi:hypothetical protein
VWFLPLLVLGAIVIAAVSRSPREQPALGRPALPASPGVPPGPISVLGEFVRIGQVPPPPVILCAIAEAETIGRPDLASDIVRLFIAPVVYRHQLASSRQSPVQYERGSCALPRSPRRTADAVMAPQSPQSAAAREAIPYALPTTDEEIRAMLNADPARFMDIARGKVVIDVPVAPAPTASPEPSHVAPLPPPPEAVARMQESADIQEAADQARAMAPGSPLVGVSDEAWRLFVARLERESPQFSSSRHVGQYRQRRERLAELGVDPSVILNSAQAQRAALDLDLTDAHRHALEGDVLSTHLSRPIVVPGCEETVLITLSGLLGVIQCAGLDGAVGWLERQSDRKRYPHTTQAFLRTNGVF